MDLFCDFNIPDSLISALQSDGAFDVEEVENVLSRQASNSQKSSYASKDDRVLLTADHEFLQNSYSHGVIYYSDSTLKDSRAVRLIKQIKNHNSAPYASVAASIP